MRTADIPLVSAMFRQQSIAIVGGGLMGAGIAQVFATAGHAVTVFEPTPSVRATVRSLRRLLTAHPWLVTLILRGPVLGDGVYRASEAGLRELRETGLPADTVAAVFRLLHSYTIGYVGMELARRSVDPARYAAFEARRYPTRAAIGPHLGPFGEEQFEAGLDVIVSGLEAMAERRQPARRPRR